MKYILYRGSSQLLYTHRKHKSPGTSARDTPAEKQKHTNNETDNNNNSLYLSVARRETQGLRVVRLWPTAVRLIYTSCYDEPQQTRHHGSPRRVSAFMLMVKARA